MPSPPSARAWRTGRMTHGASGAIGAPRSLACWRSRTSCRRSPTPTRPLSARRAHRGDAPLREPRRAPSRIVPAARPRGPPSSCRIHRPPEESLMPTTFVLNERTVTLDADADMPLLWAIREFAHLHGTKFGCGMALCGACTAHLDGVPIRSCVMPLSQVAGRKVTTIEGLQSKPAKAVQASWVNLQVPQVRLLSVGPDHVGDRAAREKPLAHRCRHRQRDEWEYLSLCDLYAYSSGDPRRRRLHQGLSMNAQALVPADPPAIPQGQCRARGAHHRLRVDRLCQARCRGGGRRSDIRAECVRASGRRQ